MFLINPHLAPLLPCWLICFQGKYMWFGPVPSVSYPVSSALGPRFHTVWLWHTCTLGAEPGLRARGLA